MNISDVGFQENQSTESSSLASFAMEKTIDFTLTASCAVATAALGILAFYVIPRTYFVVLPGRQLSDYYLKGFSPQYVLLLSATLPLFIFAEGTAIAATLKAAECTKAFFNKSAMYPQKSDCLKY